MKVDVVIKTVKNFASLADIFFIAKKLYKKHKENNDN